MHRQVDKQTFSRLVVMQNSSLVQNTDLQSKMLKHQKQDILQRTYPKYTTNLSVSTLSTQKEAGGVGGGRQRHCLPKSHQYCQKCEWQGKNKAKESSLFSLPQHKLVIFTLRELCTLGSLLFTNASKRFGSSHLGKMTP